VRLSLLIGLCLLCQTGWAASQSDLFPQVAHAYRVEIDGAPAWQRQAEKRLPPASLTKLMTALLVLEKSQPDDIVRVSPAAARETGSRLGLKADERFRVSDLLAATLLQSANDACHALADHVAGSESAFVELMNQRARTLGLRDTRFGNACGHDAHGHYSSASDLARLSRILLEQPPVLALTSQPRATITSVAGKPYALTNKNALIGRYRGARGLKTGYTSRAGKCLIAYAERDGHRVLLVILHGNDRWWDAVDILDIAFEHARLTH